MTLCTPVILEWHIYGFDPYNDVLHTSNSGLAYYVLMRITELCTPVILVWNIYGFDPYYGVVHTCDPGLVYSWF